MKKHLQSKLDIFLIHVEITHKPFSIVNTGASQKNRTPVNFFFSSLGHVVTIPKKNQYLYLYFEYGGQSFCT